MPTDMELHAKVSLMLDKQGAAQTKKDLRDAEKIVADLGKSADKTSQKLKDIERLEGTGALDTADALAARRQAQFEGIQETAEGLPIVGRFAKGMFSPAGAVAASAGVGAAVVHRQLRLLQQIADNTAASIELGLDEGTITTLADQIQRTDARISQEQATEAARGVADFAARHRYTIEQALSHMRRVTAGMDPITRAEFLRDQFGSGMLGLITDRELAPPREGVNEVWGMDERQRNILDFAWQEIGRKGLFMLPAMLSGMFPGHIYVRNARETVKDVSNMMTESTESKSVEQP